MDRPDERSPQTGKSEVLDGDIAALLSRAKLENGEYRRFTRQRQRGSTQVAQTVVATKVLASPDHAPEAGAAATVSHPRDGSAAILSTVKVTGLAPADATEVGPGRALHALRAAFSRGAAPATPNSPLRLGLFSLDGGVGCTTIAANLGAILSHMGQQVLLVETSEIGGLAYFFGAHHSRPGLRTFVPAGDGQPPLKLLTPERIASQWFEAEVTSASAGAGCTILDLRPMPNEALVSALALCSVLLVPVMADARSLRSLALLPELLNQLLQPGAPRPEIYYVLNKFRETSPFAQKAREFLEQQLGDKLLRFHLHWAEEIAESAAAGLTLQDYAPDSPSAKTLGEIARWLQAHACRISTLGAARWSER